MQKWMSDLQPQLQEIQEKYKNDPQRLSQETMKVFKTSGKWPLKWCLMLLIQMPIFLWLFYVVKNYADNSISSDSLYSFLFRFGEKFLSVSNVNTNFLWIDLLAKNNLFLALFAGFFTYLQMKLTNIVKPATPKSIPWMKWTMPDMSKMMWFMWIFMAFIMWSFVYSTQSWVWIYIVTTTLFSCVQYIIQYRIVIKTKIMLLLWKRIKPQIVEKIE